MLFKDRVCLAIDSADSGRAQATARDFRACTTTVKVGPTALLAEGPLLIRGLGELGITDIIADIRLYGHPHEIWQTVLEAAKFGCIKAVTIQSMLGASMLELAVTAAETSTKITKFVKHPFVLAVGLPVNADMQLVSSLLDTKTTRRACMRRLTSMCCAAGIHGMLIDFDDIPYVRSVSKELPILVHAKRRPTDYTETFTSIEQDLPGITEVLNAGATHAIFDMALIPPTKAVEWTADLVTKELDRVEGPTNGRMRHILAAAK